MTLGSEIYNLQLSISSLISETGIDCRNINLSFRSNETFSRILSITWDFQYSNENIDYLKKISQKQFVESLLDCISQSGLNPIQCSLTICMKDINLINVLDWKLNKKNNDYYSMKRIVDGIKIYIQFISSLPIFGEYSVQK